MQAGFVVRKHVADERAHAQRAAIEARKTMARRGDVPFFDVRAARNGDLAKLCDAWLQSYRFSPVAQAIPPDIYRIEQRDRIRRLMSRGRVLCAVDVEDSTRVCGWICFEPPRGPGKHAVMHYLSVHPSLQNLGLGAALVKLVRDVCEDRDMPIFCTHFTYPMRRLLARWNLIYNPYLLEVRPEAYP